MSMLMVEQSPEAATAGAIRSAAASGWLGKLEAGYGVVRLLSIDVALAALGGGVMASRITGGRAQRAFYLLLPLAVWVVYTLDHLMDAARVGPGANTARHRFHFRHAAALTVAVVALGGFCGVLGVVSLSPPNLACGAAVAVLFALHEMLVKLAGGKVSLFLTKEFGVAAIFTAGTWGIPLAAALAAHRDPRPAIVPAVQYLLLALANLLIFSIFEAKADARDRHSSFVQAIGRRRAGVTCVLVLLIAILLMPLAVWLNPTRANWLAQGLIALMAIGLAVILQFPRRFARYERFRSLGDGVFLIPLIMAVVR